MAESARRGQSGSIPNTSRSTWALRTPTRRAPSASSSRIATFSATAISTRDLAAARRPSRQGDKPRRAAPVSADPERAAHAEDTRAPVTRSVPDADGWHTLFFGSGAFAATDGNTVTVTVSGLSNPDGTPLPTQHDFSVAIAEVEVLEAAVVLHSIPTDFAECQQDPFLADSTAVNGAGANAKPTIPGGAGSWPHWYNSKSKAETGCQKAGCGRLATDAELEGALYPKKELDGIVWQDGSPTGRATPHFRTGLCARGWVSDRDDLRFWMPKDGKNAEACPAGYSSKPASQKGSAYCVGCPAIHRCTSLSLPPSPATPPPPLPPLCDTATCYEYPTYETAVAACNAKDWSTALSVLTTTAPANSAATPSPVRARAAAARLDRYVRLFTFLNNDNCASVGAVPMNRQECAAFYTWLQTPYHTEVFGGVGVTLLGTEMADVTGDVRYGYGCQIWPTPTEISVYYDDDISEPLATATTGAMAVCKVEASSMCVGGFGVVWSGTAHVAGCSAGEVMTSAQCQAFTDHLMASQANRDVLALGASLAGMNTATATSANSVLAHGCQILIPDSGGEMRIFHQSDTTDALAPSALTEYYAVCAVASCAPPLAPPVTGRRLSEDTNPITVEGCSVASTGTGTYKACQCVVPPAAALAACIASRSFPDNTLKKDNKPEFQRQSWEFGCQRAHDLTASVEECTANVRGLAAWRRRPGGCCGFVDGCHSSACSGGKCCEASGEISDLACATYWNYVPPPPSPPPRLCSVGVLNPSGSICCESTCDQCGDTGCGAAANCDNQGRGCGGLCCQEEISDSGVMCMNANDDVCIMPSPPSSPPPPLPSLPKTAATGPTFDLEGPVSLAASPSPPPPMIPLPADLNATALDACYEEEEQGAVGTGQHYITRHWVEALYMCEQDPLCVGLVRMKETGLIYVRRGKGPWEYGTSTRRVRKADCYLTAPPPPSASPSPPPSAAPSPPPSTAPSRRQQRRRRRRQPRRRRRRLPRRRRRHRPRRRRRRRPRGRRRRRPRRWWRRRRRQPRRRRRPTRRPSTWRLCRRSGRRWTTRGARAGTTCVGTGGSSAAAARCAACAASSSAAARASRSARSKSRTPRRRRRRRRRGSRRRRRRSGAPPSLRRSERRA